MLSLKPVEDLSTPELVQTLSDANAAYRSGAPVMSDETYDQVYLRELRERDPEHPYLDAVEPERTELKGKVRHLVPMLSTEKAYTQDEVAKFVDRVTKAAISVGVPPEDVAFRLTPKLDGMAGKFLDSILSSRGDGLTGSDITRNLHRGLVAMGGKNTGVGEIVTTNEYFDKHLSDHFSHPRNFVAGLIGSDDLNEFSKKALNDGAIHFVPYSELSSITADFLSISSSIEALCEELERKCPYPVDGTVIDVMNKEVQKALGSTSHHNCWQLAKKKKGETAEAEVRGITWQTGRTGRITPVINIDPVHLSGAELSNVTGHHAGNIRNLNIGIGAKIEIIRSGEVIPTLLGVKAVGNDCVIPSECSVCSAPTQWERDFLVCTGSNCSAKVETQLLHFFKTMGNVDLFGPKTVSTLVAGGFGTLEKIYAINAADLEELGFGQIQSVNLLAELYRSRTEEIEDWRFLAAFGIHNLGKGDSRKLLKVHPLLEVGSLTKEDLLKIEGFGEITSTSIPELLKNRWDTIQHMLSLGFSLRSDEVAIADTPISGKNLVFTGSMSSSRNEMKESAIRLGATVQSSVNKKTDLLVIGEKVGAKKIESAKKNGTVVIAEADYLKMIGETA